jgi:Zn-dependent oligopeptidase
VPEEMVESIIKAKNCDTGLLNLRQAFFGTFDMTCHTAKEKVCGN